MSKLGKMIFNSPLCNTTEMQDFLKKIEASFQLFPEGIKQVMDDNLVAVFEKGLILGLHHFNTEGGEEYEE